MRKFFIPFLMFISVTTSAQTLFYYGDDSVSVNEFLRAYNKNKTSAGNEKAFREYLDLYIASRLKIKEARERRFDTLPQIVSDLASLREQILPSYLADKSAVDRLVEEAYQRSQKDLHLLHLFISFGQNGSVDTPAAARKMDKVISMLKNGTGFNEVAKSYSDDPSAKQNGGDLNWVTVFNLPYELENLAFTTPVGQISRVYRSKAGYHIFKKLAERKNAGRIRAAQILIALPPGTDAAARAVAQKLADSLYNRLLKGDDIGKLAAQFSNDLQSATANGQMQEFGVGDYDPVFENTVFALQKNGISKPFVTAHGYHIVKLLEKISPVSKSDAKGMAALRNKVEQSDRINTTKTALARKILKEAHFVKSSFSESALWVYSDSILNGHPAGNGVAITGNTPLFQLGQKKILASDWINYTQVFRYKPDGTGIKPYPALWEEFIQSTALNYFQDNLEQYNADFRDQINEFRDGNLFFEIMQREVWGPAQSDSVALFNHFNQNRSKYIWKPSVDAVMFFANDLGSANSFRAELKKGPANWKKLLTGYEDRIAVDSARFELAQVPNPLKQSLAPGVITSPLLNKADNTASFAYIIRNHHQPGPRSFAEARGMVITDYQLELEKKWLSELHKKFKVRINEPVFRSLIAARKF